MEQIFEYLLSWHKQIVCPQALESIGKQSSLCIVSLGSTGPFPF